MIFDTQKLPGKTVPGNYAGPSIQAGYGTTTFVVGSPGKPQSTPSARPPPRWMTVKQLAQAYAGIVTEGSLRNLIWNAEAHSRNPTAKSNGFLPVVLRPGGGRKVLLDRIAFEDWLTSNQHVRGA